MERVEHRFDVHERALLHRDGEPASCLHWRRLAEPRSGNPLPRRDVGNGLFPTHLRGLPTPPVRVYRGVAGGARCYFPPLAVRFEAGYILDQAVFAPFPEGAGQRGGFGEGAEVADRLSRRHFGSQRLHAAPSGIPRLKSMSSPGTGANVAISSPETTPEGSSLN